MSVDFFFAEGGRVRGFHARQVLLEGDERRGFDVRGFGGYCFDAAHVFGVNGADRQAVLAVAFEEVLAGLFGGGLAAEAQPPGQQVDGVRLGGQAVGLAVVHQLQVMFDGAQEDVAVGQHAAFVGRQQPGAHQARQSLERGAPPQLGVFAAVGHLQELHHKFHVADRAFAQFDFAPVAAFGAQDFFGALFHGMDAGPHGFCICAEDGRADLFQRLLAQGEIAGDGARLEQGLFFPEQGAAVEVGQVIVEVGDERAVAAPGAQAHIDAV